MKVVTFLIAATATTAIGGLIPAVAATAPSYKEAKPSDLGKTLTKFGAIKAGNEAGTIPPYTGGLKPSDKAAKEKPYPFANEKPRLVIDQDNMDKYADKLDAGTKYLLKHYPNYKVRVFPTHRSASYSDSVLKHTVKNAGNAECKLKNNGYAVAEACRLGLPFPLPKNGNEALWNHQLTWKGISRKNYVHNLYEAGGDTVQTVAATSYFNNGFYAKDNPNPQIFRQIYGNSDYPPGLKGNQQLQRFFLNPEENGGRQKKTWVYTPGLRRVKLTPNAIHDTPTIGSAGNATYGEQFLYAGLPDRFNWKIEGRKEMFIPYNNLKMGFGCDDDKTMQPKNPNPDCIRWELHRVWKVVGTLKSGKHSIYSKRVYWFDADTFDGGVYNAYDHSGDLFRLGMLLTIPIPKYHFTVPIVNLFWNLTKEGYFLENYATSKHGKISYQEFVDTIRTKLYPSDFMSPSAMQGAGYF